MADGIDALMKQVQAADRQSVLDLVLPQSDLEQLAARNHPVLPARKLR